VGCPFIPELRLDVQLKHRLNQTAEVMTENLAECFVDLRCLGFASRELPNFALIMLNVDSTFDRYGNAPRTILG
jgi:hypothetical protein